MSRVVLGPLRIVVQVVSVVLFVMVWVSALLGDTDPFRNLAPTWIYVIFWLGVPALSVLFGNVWRGLSPWRALADLFVWLRELGGGEARPLAEYPERFGRWPGAVVLFAFATMELAYSDPASPRALAFAIAVYTYIALFGMASFGGHVDAHRQGLRRVLRAPRSDRTAVRPRRPDPPPLAADGSRREGHDPWCGGLRGRDARHGPRSTDTRGRPPGRT